MSDIENNMGVDKADLNGKDGGVPTGAPAGSTPETVAAQLAEQAALEKKANEKVDDGGGEAVLSDKFKKDREQDAINAELAKKKANDEAAAAEKAAEEAKEAEAGTADNKVIQKWDHVGNPSADAAIDLMQEKGMTPEDAQAVFGESLKTGKLSDVDVPALKAKIGDAAAALVMQGIESYHATAEAATQKTVAAVHEVMGGQDNWAKVQDWTQSTNNEAFLSKRDDFRTMLNAGGTQAVLAAKEIKAMYEADKGTINKDLVSGETVPASNMEPLSRAAYLAQIKAVENGRDPLPVKARKRSEVRAARALGRQRGL